MAPSNHVDIFFGDFKIMLAVVGRFCYEMKDALITSAFGFEDFQKYDRQLVLAGGFFGTGKPRYGLTEKGMPEFGFVGSRGFGRRQIHRP